MIDIFINSILGALALAAIALVCFAIWVAYVYASDFLSKELYAYRTLKRVCLKEGVFKNTREFSQAMNQFDYKPDKFAEYISSRI